MLKPEDGNNFARDEQLRSDGCGKNLSKNHVQASSCPTGTPLPPTEVAPSATLPTECLLCLLLHSWYKSIHSVWNFLNRCVKCLWWLSVRGLIPQFKDQKMVQSWLPWGFFSLLGCHGDRLQTDVSMPLQTLPVLAMPKMKSCVSTVWHPAIWIYWGL